MIRKMGMRTPSWRISVFFPEMLPGVVPPTSPPVRADDGVDRHSCAVEQRGDDRHVVQVRSARIGVVVDEYVARVDVTPEALDHLADFHRHGEDVDGVVLRHGDELPLAVHEHAGEIVPLVDDGGIRRPHHVRPHLPDDGHEGFVDDFQGYGVYFPNK